MRRWFVMVTVVFPVAACSLLTNVGDLSSAVDAGSPPDAGVKEAAARSFCASLSPPPKFCDDFDEHDTPFGWTSTSTGLGGHVELSDAASVSPPGSLMVTLPSVSGSATPAAFLVHEFPEPSSRATLSFDVSVESFGPNYGALAQLHLGSTGLLFVLTSNFGLCQEIFPGADNVLHKFTTFPTQGSGFWHVVIDLAMGAPVHATVTLGLAGDARTQTVIDRLALDPAVRPGPVKLDLGVAWVTSPSPPWTMRFDNVVYDAD